MSSALALTWTWLTGWPKVAGALLLALISGQRREFRDIEAILERGRNRCFGSCVLFLGEGGVCRVFASVLQRTETGKNISQSRESRIIQTSELGGLPFVFCFVGFLVEEWRSVHGLALASAVQDWRNLKTIARLSAFVRKISLVDREKSLQYESSVSSFLLKSALSRSVFLGGASSSLST